MSVILDEYKEKENAGKCSPGSRGPSPFQGCCVLELMDRGAPPSDNRGQCLRCVYAPGPYRIPRVSRLLGGPDPDCLASNLTVAHASFMIL